MTATRPRPCTLNGKPATYTTDHHIATVTAEDGTTKRWAHIHGQDIMARGGLFHY